MTMQIVKPYDENGWITAVIDGRWVQAKVCDEPSCYGIDDGRVSKLCVGKTNHYSATDAAIAGLTFFDCMDFNYDRGLDFDNLPAGMLDSIVAQLEHLPKQFS